MKNQQQSDSEIFRALAKYALAAPCHIMTAVELVAAASNNTTLIERMRKEWRIVQSKYPWHCPRIGPTQK